MLQLAIELALELAVRVNDSASDRVSRKAAPMEGRPFPLGATIVAATLADLRHAVCA